MRLAELLTETYRASPHHAEQHLARLFEEAPFPFLQESLVLAARPDQPLDTRRAAANFFRIKLCEGLDEGKFDEEVREKLLQMIWTALVTQRDTFILAKLSGGIETVLCKERKADFWNPLALRCEKLFREVEGDSWAFRYALQLFRALKRACENGVVLFELSHRVLPHLLGATFRFIRLAMGSEGVGEDGLRTLRANLEYLLELVEQLQEYGLEGNCSEVFKLLRNTKQLQVVLVQILILGQDGKVDQTTVRLIEEGREPVHKLLNELKLQACELLALLFENSLDMLVPALLVGLSTFLALPGLRGLLEESHVNNLLVSLLDLVCKSLRQSTYSLFLNYQFVLFELFLAILPSLDLELQLNQRSQVRRHLDSLHDMCGLQNKACLKTAAATLLEHNVQTIDGSLLLYTNLAAVGLLHCFETPLDILPSQAADFVQSFTKFTAALSMPRPALAQGLFLMLAVLHDKMNNRPQLQAMVYKLCSELEPRLLDRLPLQVLCAYFTLLVYFPSAQLLPLTKTYLTATGPAAQAFQYSLQKIFEHKHKNLTKEMQRNLALIVLQHIKPNTKLYTRAAKLLLASAQEGEPELILQGLCQFISQTAQESVLPEYRTRSIYEPLELLVDLFSERIVSQARPVLQTLQIVVRARLPGVASATAKLLLLIEGEGFSEETALLLSAILENQWNDDYKECIWIMLRSKQSVGLVPRLAPALCSYLTRTFQKGNSAEAREAALIAMWLAVKHNVGIASLWDTASTCDRGLLCLLGTYLLCGLGGSLQLFLKTLLECESQITLELDCKVLSIVTCKLLQHPHFSGFLMAHGERLFLTLLNLLDRQAARSGKESPAYELVGRKGAFQAFRTGNMEKCAFEEDEFRELKGLCRSEVGQLLLPCARERAVMLCRFQVVKGRPRRMLRVKH